MDIFLLVLFAVLPMCALIGVILYSIFIRDFEEDEEDWIEK